MWVTHIIYFNHVCKSYKGSIFFIVWSVGFIVEVILKESRVDFGPKNGDSFGQVLGQLWAPLVIRGVWV